MMMSIFFMRLNKTETLEINYIWRERNKNLFLLTWLWFILQNINQSTSPILKEIYLAGKSFTLFIETQKTLQQGIVNFLFDQLGQTRKERDFHYQRSRKAELENLQTQHEEIMPFYITLTINYARLEEFDASTNGNLLTMQS